MKQALRKTIPEKEIPKVIYTGTKSGTHFNIKDKTKTEHKHNLVYKVTCPNPTCNDSYIGKTARRLNERVKEHDGPDNKSHFHHHTTIWQHKEVSIKNFTIISNNQKNYKKRKINEALKIIKQKPSLNTQK